MNILVPSRKRRRKIMKLDTTNTKLELLYNYMLKIISLITIVLYTKPMIFIFQYIFQSLDRETLVKSLGRNAEGFVASIFMESFFIVAFISLALLYFITYLVLIIVTVCIRKARERKPRWFEIIYLLFLGFIVLIASAFYSDLAIVEKGARMMNYVIDAMIILLIVILLQRKKREGKEN